MPLLIDNEFTLLPIADLERPKAAGYGARIGNLNVRLAVDPATPIRPYTRDSIAGREANTSNVYENVLDVGFTFARQNLTGGEGLEFFPRELARANQALDEIRYFDSKDLDMQRAARGLPFEIKLVKEPETWYTPGAVPADMAASKDKLYVAEGDEVHQFDDWADSTPDASQVLVGSSDIIQIDVDGSDNAVALVTDGTMWFKPLGTSTWTQIPNTGSVLDDTVAFWMVKDRIILYQNDPATAADALLVELTLASTGTPALPTIVPTAVTIDTFKAAVSTVIDASTVILVATDDGYLRSYVPQTDTAGGTPALTIRAKRPVPIAEYAYAVGHNNGTVLVLTTEISQDGTKKVTRAYQGDVLDERFDFVVGPLQLLREWNDAQDTINVNLRVATARDSFYWTIRESDGASYVWRQDLVTTGIFREQTLEAAGAVERLLVWRDRIVFINGSSIDRIAATYPTSGYVITPNINFGLNTDIVWLASMLQAENIRDGEGAQVELYFSTDVAAINDPNHASWRLITRLSNQAAAGIENPLLDFKSKTLSMMLVIYNNNSGADTPRVTRFAVRGYPQHRDWILEIPVNISDSIEAPNRRPYLLAGWGDVIHNQLMELQGSQVECFIYDPPLQFRGVVDNILESTDYVSDRGSAGKVCLVQLRGARVTSGASAPTGDAGMGLGLMGVATMGIGQTGAT